LKKQEHPKIKQKSAAQGRRSIRQELLQKDPFRAILRQKVTAGVSLAVTFLLVLQRKRLFFKCFAVLRSRFFLTLPL